MRPPTLRRALAAPAAVALVLTAVAGLSLILLSGAISAQAPDPSIPNGDPCCWHPDTWGEVASGVGWTLGYVVVDGVLIAGAVALFKWSSSGTWPRWRRLLLIPLGGFLAGVIVFAVVLIPKLDQGQGRGQARQAQYGGGSRFLPFSRNLLLAGVLAVDFPRFREHRPTEPSA